MKMFDFLKNLFHKKDAGYSYKNVSYVSALSQVPGNTKSTIYIVQAENVPKWAVFQCPNNCGRRIELCLMKNRHPKWTLKIRNKKVTLSPSIVVDDCGAHFFIEDNKVSLAYFDN